MTISERLCAKFSARQLQMAPSLLGVVADLILGLFLYQKIANYPYIKKLMLVVFESQGIDPHYLSEELLSSYFHLIANTTLSLLFLFFIVHLIIYYFAFRQKSFAERYLQLYFATGLLGFVGLFLTAIFSPSSWTLLAIIEILLYAAGFISLRYRQRSVESKEQ